MSKTAFLFPGQGAQSVGMAREACQALPAAQQLFERAERVLGYDLAELCFHGPAEKLDSTVHSQPALLVSSLAGLELLKHQSPGVVDAVSAVAGLSLGEYTALVCAGAIDFEDALRVVQQRGAAMQAAADAVPSGMVSLLGMEADAVARYCDSVREQGEVLQIANYLCPGNIAISGHQSACRRATESAVQAGAMKAIPLAVAGAFHTSLMESAVEPLAAAIQEAQWRTSAIPVISNVDAKPHQDPGEICELLVRQIASPVQWEASMQYLLESGCDQFYEIGPGRVLRGLMKRMNRKIPCESVSV